MLPSHLLFHPLIPDTQSERKAANLKSIRDLYEAEIDAFRATIPV